MKNNRHKYFGIRSKIVTCTILCVVAVGLISNLFLYQYMHRIIDEKVKSIEGLHANTIAAQLNYALERVLTLDFYCVYSEDVMNALRMKSLETIPARNAALTAQNTMNSYLRTSPIDSYINKLLIFNDSGVLVHAVSTYSGRSLDYPRLLKSEQYSRWKSGQMQPFDQVYHSVNPGGPDCFVLFSKVYPLNSSSTPLGYVYTEIDSRIVSDILAPYNNGNHFFVQTSAKNQLISNRTSALSQFLPLDGDQSSFRFENSVYSISRYPLAPDTLTLISCVNQSVLMADNQDVLFSVAMVLLMIFSIATAVLVILTHYITRPIGRIIEKINKIAFNDYSYDPELEKPNNEMGEVGAHLNEMGLAVQKLLDETIALHDERARIEMALLQSQVNPHFLYNTLNSIHYMAVIQKNMGIQKMVRSLVNLLKNVSKGVSDKISLSEELDLVEDYVNIQSIRYMGAFDYVCKAPEELKTYKIIKFTLQPLVENAIIHGIVPKGTFGTVAVDAHEEGKFLVVTVTDDGVGMLREEADDLLKMEGRHDKSSMRGGIGLANVNRRLELAYGHGCGLSAESEKGVYTKISVRILKEN